MHDTVYDEDDVDEKAVEESQQLSASPAVAVGTPASKGNQSTSSTPGLQKETPDRDMRRVLHGEHGKYTMCEYRSIMPLMESLIKDVVGLLDISRDSAQILLQRCKWDRERMIDVYYGSSEELARECGIGSEMSVPSPPIECPICCDVFADITPMYRLLCGHLYCRGCYGTYLGHKVGEGPLCVSSTCPEYKCAYSVPASAFKSLLPFEQFAKYEEYVVRNFIETSKTMRWCPGPGCQMVAVGNGVSTVRCSCSYIFCFRCGEEAHAPCSCEQRVQWMEKCADVSETANWLLVNTKCCPRCKVRIEKNQGCNHMTCRNCRNEFCWICMGSWQEHNANTGGYYKCNRYEGGGVGDEKDKTARAKVELERYLHYYQRFHGHGQAAKFAATQREAAERRMVALQEHEKSAWIDVQFLKQAVEMVIECRRVLKYTYALGYFLKEQSQAKELFEYHQEMLEKNNERLSELTEMSDITTDVRTQIVNLTRVTERFMHSLLDTVVNGVVDVSTDVLLSAAYEQAATSASLSAADGVAVASSSAAAAGGGNGGVDGVDAASASASASSASGSIGAMIRDFVGSATGLRRSARLSAATTTSAHE